MDVPYAHLCTVNGFVPVPCLYSIPHDGGRGARRLREGFPTLSHIFLIFLKTLINLIALMAITAYLHNQDGLKGFWAGVGMCACVIVSIQAYSGVQVRVALWP